MGANELRTRRRGLVLGLTAASLGVVYGYDLSNIAGALLFITDEFGLTTRQQELVTTAVVLGEIVGALGAGVLANLIGRRRSMVWWRPAMRCSHCWARCRTRCPCCWWPGYCWA